jgi:LysR family transcriptional regulator, low CO2-responsive transcriptional regulator
MQVRALPRKDKVLLPPAQAMLDFLSTKGKHFLPRTYGRLRLTRSLRHLLASR